MAQYELSEDNLNHILEALDYYWDAQNSMGWQLTKEDFEPFKKVYEALIVKHNSFNNGPQEVTNNGQ